MSNTANAGMTAEVADRGLQPLRIKWGWIVALGVVFLIAGLIALSSVVMATAVSVTVVGAMMLVSGIAEIISAFSVRTWGKFFLWVLPTLEACLVQTDGRGAQQNRSNRMQRPCLGCSG
jgi:uncharacterized membrane protein HdeD (DUF308 family)